MKYIRELNEAHKNIKKANWIEGFMFGTLICVILIIGVVLIGSCDEKKKEVQHEDTTINTVLQSK